MAFSGLLFQEPPRSTRGTFPGCPLPCWQEKTVTDIAPKNLVAAYAATQGAAHLWERANQTKTEVVVADARMIPAADRGRGKPDARGTHTVQRSPPTNCKAATIGRAPTG